MRKGDGFLFVYSITDKISLGQMPQLRTQLLRVKDADKIPMVLVGNKSDLEIAREVHFRDGEDMAKKLMCPFFETSAKLPQNVEEAFTAVVREIKKEEVVKHGGTECKPKKKSGCNLL